MLLQTAFALLIGRYSNQSDVVIGSPIAGRVHQDVEPLIGFFVNTLVLRTDLSAQQRFAELLQASKATILDGYSHQHIPFEMLVDELAPKRHLSYGPIVQIMFALQSVSADTPFSAPQNQQVTATPEAETEESEQNAIDMTARYELELNVKEIGGGCRCAGYIARCCLTVSSLTK
jgi:non-ribosomal peptide synthetase component F